MWSDTFLAIERVHLLRLGAWGVACILVGTLLLALLTVRRQRSPLVRHFAIQTALWGLVEAAIAGIGLRRLVMRDYAAAARFDRLLWLNVGLDVGYLAVGATLAFTGWLLGRRLAAVGAGVGVVVQGAALVALDLLVLGQIGSTL
jgi:hypothetical protein